MQNNSNYFNKKTKYIDAIGLNTLIMLSKDLFPNNEDIKNYTTDNFKIDFKEYLFKSRTMLVARSNRYIYELNDEELKILYKYMINYLNNNTEEEKENNLQKNNKSKANLKTWLENI